MLDPAVQLGESPVRSVLQAVELGRETAEFRCEAGAAAKPPTEFALTFEQVVQQRRLAGEESSDFCSPLGAEQVGHSAIVSVP